jgi:hypothetical protein
MMDGMMEGKRVGVVVSHVAHLLTIAGMVMRWHPHILVLTRSDREPGSAQAEVVRAGLTMLGLQNLVTELQIGEETSYAHALTGNFSFHLEALPRILAWIGQVRPDAVFGDAFELSNYQHDVGRLLLDAAIARRRAQGAHLQNYEIPLSARLARPGAILQFGTFLCGPSEQFRLTANEVELKRRIVDLAVQADPFVAYAAPLFPAIDIETFREIPHDRDYSIAPPELARHYDERGREEVRANRYVQAITFDEHFRPLVQALRGSSDV